MTIYIMMVVVKVPQTEQEYGVSLKPYEVIHLPSNAKTAPYWMWTLLLFGGSPVALDPAFVAAGPFEASWLDFVHGLA